MITGRALFRACTCCPSPCRSEIPAGDDLQSQTTTPSSLAMIALAVIDGQLAFSPATRAALKRTAQARLCVSACPYGYDIASAITEFVAEQDRDNAPDEVHP